jgi:unspecific monooxygenase
LNAGHGATVHAIGNGVKTMLDQAVDARRAFASESAAQATVEELLRLDPPLHLFARYALEEAEFAGVRLRRGEKIGLLLGAANRDPERFPSPDAFQPDRAPNGHVSFGAGVHFCVGAPLARLELAVALPVLFTRLEGLRLIERPRYRDTFHFHGLEALRVEWA